MVILSIVAISISIAALVTVNKTEVSTAEKFVKNLKKTCHFKWSNFIIIIKLNSHENNEI